jgi:arsenite methyltransferase
MSETVKPDYGIDAPGIIRNFLIVGIGFPVLALFLPTVTLGPMTVVLMPMALSIGIVFIFQGVAMLLYAKIGKFHHRDRILACISWTGNERVLDVGTGRGLLLVGAAKKLTTGRAMGIDIWSKQDLSGNSPEKTLHNLEIEGIRDQVEIKNDDATKMSFPDSSFDVVLSNLCIHNIPSREGRDQACREILRVLKPGGRAIISDFKNTANYARVFESGGATVSRGAPDFLHTFPPLRIVEVTKARSQ